MVVGSLDGEGWDCVVDVEAGFGGCGEAVLGVAAGPRAPGA